jgi:FAD/FMN-containing dehydrogenase
VTLQEVKDIAGKCVHYAMCRIDFLGTGVCASGIKSGYVSYYPQGRMEIVSALVSDVIPVTERLVDVAQSCTLCGRCDKQCYFVRELRPIKVMKALKQHIESHLEQGLPVVRPEEDDALRQLRAVTGKEWATNDPAVLVTYSVDRFPSAEQRMPQYVVMPASTAEVQEVVRIARARGLAYTARGHGASSFAVALGDGIIIDLTRMKQLEVNPQNWSATLGPGVTAFELQKEATKHGMRAAVVEPAACVCANLISTNMHSLFSHAYGMGPDHCSDAQFVNEDGDLHMLNDKHTPNPFHFDKEGGAQSPGICTQATVRLYPMTDDESAVLVPFPTLQEAAALAREVGRRRIGFAAGILGADYVSAFLSPTNQTAESLKRVFQDQMGLEYGLVVLGDKYDLAAVEDMADVTLDETLIRSMMLSLPQLHGEEGLALLSDLPRDGELYKVLFDKDMAPLIEAALSPSPDNVAAAVPEDMREFYRELYTRPEMTNLVWLNMFRILSSRTGRGRPFYGMVMYMPLDDLDMIAELCAQLKAVGDKHRLRNDFGYLIPLDFGKRAALEYDFYHDHTNPQERERAQAAAQEAAETIDRYMKKMNGRSAAVVPYQGLCRKEKLLYVSP